MNTNALLLSGTLVLTVAFGGEPTAVKDAILQGPRIGETRIITNTVAFPREASVVQTNALVALTVQGQRINVPVELFAYRHKFQRIRGTNVSSFTCYEFQVRAKGDDGFMWSIWTPDVPQPHRFQVLTTESGKGYACYIREGVQLFRLSDGRDSAAMRHGFWEAPGEFESHHPDALPLLRMDLLQQSLGWTNTIGLGPQTWNITVDKLSDATGELRVTVHGASPQPECAFALRNKEWVLLSTVGK